MGIIKKLKDSTEKSVEKGIDLGKKGIRESVDISRQTISESKEALNPETLRDLKESLKKEKDRIIKIWKSDKVLYYKDDYTAILVRKLGKEVEFFKEFSNLTKQGYKLELREEIREIPLYGINFSVGVFYYFQNTKYVN